MQSLKIQAQSTGLCTIYGQKKTGSSEGGKAGDSEGRKAETQNTNIKKNISFHPPVCNLALLGAT